MDAEDVALRVGVAVGVNRMPRLSGHSSGENEMGSSREAKLGAAEDAIVKDVPGRDLRLRVQFYVASYDFLLQAASGGGGKH